MRGQVSSLQHQLRQQQAHAEALGAQLQREQQGAAQLRQDAEDAAHEHAAEVQQLAEQCKQAEGHASALQRELESAQQAASSSADELRQRLAHAEAQGQESRDAYSSSQAACQELQHRFNLLQEQHEGVQRAKHELRVCAASFWWAHAKATLPDFRCLQLPLAWLHLICV